MSSIHSYNLVRPFLRWAGGKQKLLSALLELMPPHFTGRYFEPFLGGGSLFLANGFSGAELSDVNAHLVNAYRMVRDHPHALDALLSDHLQNLQRQHAAYYYHVREAYNHDATIFDLQQAARFIFLNHTNFNGVFRMNRRGRYNVAYGHSIRPGLPNLEHLIAVSERLKMPGVTLEHRDYRSILSNARRGDFVYLDPPLPVLSLSKNFSEYSIERFSIPQQHEFAAFAQTLRKRGVHVMISTPDVPLARTHYLDWHLHATQIRRNVSAKRPAVIAAELIITSYDP